MSHKVTFVLIGGFLGSGKTTAIARLARMYTDRGFKVAIITNDQADDLVDTTSLRTSGFDVGQVAGACFCCSFNQLTDEASRLTKEFRPNVILAEPVGSCTDLVATVIRPLMKHFDADYEVASYGVLLKPEYSGIDMSVNSKKFDSKQFYIFSKQIEEADFVIINKVDQLSPGQTAALEKLARHLNRTAPILSVSAKTGQGFDELFRHIESSGGIGVRSLEVDYDLYAEEEASLGWLNSSFTASSNTPFYLDELVLGLTQRFADTLKLAGAQIAHVKIAGSSGPSHSVANVVDNVNAAGLSKSCKAAVKSAKLTVNARVAIDPSNLTDALASVIEDLGPGQGIQFSLVLSRSFRPGRPVPVHRYGEPLQVAH